MGEIKLETCPFCGEVPEVEHETYGPWIIDHGCEFVGLIWVMEATYKKLAKTWNKRAPTTGEGGETIEGGVGR